MAIPGPGPRCNRLIIKSLNGDMSRSKSQKLATDLLVHQRCNILLATRPQLMEVCSSFSQGYHQHLPPS